MRVTTLFCMIGVATLCHAGAASAQAGLPNVGQAGAPNVGGAASSAAGTAGAAGTGLLDSAKKAVGDKLTEVKDGGKAAIAKACADQAESQGLVGKALRKFVASCKRDGAKDSAQPQKTEAR
jgi:hypothetical protein